MATTLSHEQASRVYDRIGAWQDTQAFYEDFATRDLIRHARFDSAHAVFELGCGTGRFARRLLDQHLSPDATYRAVDVSARMIDLASARLAAHGERAHVSLTDGGAPVGEPTGSCDRFVSIYVFDLLSEADIARTLDEAHRMLGPGGLLCLASLSHGHGVLSRAFIGAWSLVYRRNPALVGGCRPIDIRGFLDPQSWEIVHARALAPLAIPSEVVIARRVASGDRPA